MYSRLDTQWLYLYYSGEKLEVIGVKIKRTGKAAATRIAAMKLPTRPRGNFTKRVKEQWLKEPHVIALRRLFK
jgi:hypothetical protein